MKHATLIICVLLAGCADNLRPAATSDQVLAAQYRARTPHGVMTGVEASIIADSYRRNIAAHQAAAPDMATATSSTGTGAQN